ncbi:MAG: preprotein translocase subunit SecE [Patescibacteria group bacterium]|nr:preprotein translocase subunit SecE [Patescibacteria group bacterium]
MKIVEYVKETKGELKHVSWPTRKQAIDYTIVIIAISLATAFFLGLFDYFFSKLLAFII